MNVLLYSTITDVYGIPVRCRLILVFLYQPISATQPPTLHVHTRATFPEPHLLIVAVSGPDSDSQAQVLNMYSSTSSNYSPPLYRCLYRWSCWGTDPVLWWYSPFIIIQVHPETCTTHRTDIPTHPPPPCRIFSSVANILIRSFFWPRVNAAQT